ncbi:conserved hypothetical protein (plasmid) [Borreliella bissettiae DN127]|uniref:Uncharacterized protein n=1 Tax=Borrelia bissettiae (strain DSM 17990 / CIP 109136 / DN127) TaxID=521010 RepID=G0ANU2_BORBD|nr:conserved hypothetical protein [Borreliella bissettiae DN127]
MFNKYCKDKSEVKARKIREELDLERANLELGFINALKQYSSVELISMHAKIENLRAEIDALNKARSKKNKQVVNGEIDSLKSELDEYVKEYLIREMELYYECMKKLATANEAESKSNYKNSKGDKCTYIKQNFLQHSKRNTKINMELIYHNL